SGAVLLGDQTLTLTNASDVFAGTVFGSGGLTIAGGAQTLSGATYHTGATSIAEGAWLSLSGTGGIANSFRLVDDGVFDISASAAGASIQSLAGSGAVLLGDQTLTLTNASDVFTGTIVGSGGLTIAGGAQTLSGATYHTGATSIGEGASLSLSGSGGIANSFRLVDDGVFDISSTSAGASIQSLSGSGAVLLGDQTLTLTNAHDTFGGSLSGGGALVVAGGTQTLGGNNTHTGGTAVAHGATLSISANANLGAAGSGLALDGGTLKVNGDVAMARDIALTGSGTFDVTGAFTLSNAGGVSGSGGLVKTGTGTLALDGAVSHGGGVQVSQGTLILGGENTYAGGTAIHSGGTLRIASDGNLGQADGNVVLHGGKLQAAGSLTSGRDFTVTSQDGAIEVTGAGDTVVLEGNFSGSGRLLKDGAGTLILAGDNAGGQGPQNTPGSGWTGGLTINAGVVNVTNPYGLGWGSVALLGGTILTSVDILTGQNIAFGQGTGIDTAANTTTTLSGNIVSAGGSGSCFTKTGLGTLNVTGSAQFDSTCVMAGRLLANGNLQSVVTVESGGTLGGSGVIHGAVLVKGILSPGNSPGMLTANATVTMAPGSAFKEDIAGTQQASPDTPIGATGYYSYLHVTGASQFVIQPGVTLAPALKDIYTPGEAGYGSAPFVPSLGENYRIVTADGGISGRFSVLAQPDGLAAGTRLAAFYDVDGTHSIDLKVLPSSYGAWVADANGNSRVTGAALDRIFDLDQSGTGSAAQGRLLYVAASQTAGTLGNFVKGLSGEVHGALAAETPRAGWAVRDKVGNHLATSQGTGAAQRKAERGLWVDIARNHGDWSGDGSASGFSANRTQLVVGADVLDNGSARLGFGFSHSDADVSADLGAGSVKQNMGFVYGEYGADGFIVDGMAGYGKNKADSHRTDPTAFATALATRADGNSSMVGIGLRAPWEFKGATYEPFARLTLQRVVRDAVDEGSASAAALGLKRYSEMGTRVVAGLAAASTKSDPLATPYTYRFSVGIGADGGSLARPSQQASLAGVATRIDAPEVGRVFLQGGLTGTVQLNRRSYVYMGLTGEVRSGFSDIGGNIGVRVSF
ncbi:MAG: autotransporter outer membrane beta-barrel domain-containing protein, partial [Noviherbaspirillum sp.]